MLIFQGLFLTVHKKVTIWFIACNTVCLSWHELKWDTCGEGSPALHNPGNQSFISFNTKHLMDSPIHYIELWLIYLQITYLSQNGVTNTSIIQSKHSNLSIDTWWSGCMLSDLVEIKLFLFLEKIKATVVKPVHVAYY